MGNEDLELIFHAKDEDRKRRKTTIIFIGVFSDEFVNKAVDVLREVGCKVTVSRSSRSPRMNICGSKKGAFALYSVAFPLNL